MNWPRSPRLLALVCAGTSAIAIASVPRHAIAAGSAEATAGTPHDKEALALATAAHARARWDVKDYLGAASLFMEAYAQVPEPTLLFNAARAYQEGGRLREAVPLFELYLRLDTFDDSDSVAGRRDAERHLAAIRTELERAQRAVQQPVPNPVVAAAPADTKPPLAKPPLAAPTPTATAADAPAERPTVRRPGLFARVRTPDGTASSVAALTCLGGGGALVLAGIALHVVAGSGRADFDDRLTASRKVSAAGTTGYLDVTQRDADAALTAHDTRRAWGTGLLVVGAGAATVGAWLWLGRSEPEMPRAAVVPSYDGSSGRVLWEVAWRW